MKIDNEILPRKRFKFIPFSDNTLLSITETFITRCEQCGNIYIESPDNKDPGVCSIACGYSLRGLSYFDFL